MSAKDERRSIAMRVPLALLPRMRAERRHGRDGSAAAALRRMVREELAHPPDAATLARLGDTGCACSRRVFRLQLDMAARASLSDLARWHGTSPERVLHGLLLRAARRGD